MLLNVMGYVMVYLNVIYTVYMCVTVRWRITHYLRSPKTYIDLVLPLYLSLAAFS